MLYKHVLTNDNVNNNNQRASSIQESFELYLIIILPW